ncbi:MAG: cell division protein FtsZ [Verrucomicrobiota bacterium]
MIQLSRNYSLPERTEEEIPIKVVGVGGAGSNALDRIVLDGLEKAQLIAINTDVQSLASSVAAHKVQLGRSVTRGLGAGGDPELGYNAAVESENEIREALVDARMVFICAGLGGGTGSGATPVVAQVARDAGSLVVAFATMPFSFEGKRRAAQAEDALHGLREIADAVICFENDRMGDIVAPKAGIHQAFAVADTTISQSVRSIVNLIQRPGLIRIGFDDLLTALRSRDGRCIFGFGESDSDNRAHDALTQALKNPLMDRGRMLENASHVLVQVAGGSSMTLSEVEILMQELGRHINDETQILFGTAVDNRMGNRLSVTLISSFASAEPVAPGAPAKKPAVKIAPVHSPAVMPPIWEQQEVAPQEIPAPMEEIPSAPKLSSTDETTITGELAAADIPAEIEMEKEPEPRLILPKKKPASIKEPKPVVEKAAPPRQEVLLFEPVTRGRFEKSEPTIVEGQDLDVPTFLRKNVRVK